MGVQRNPGQNLGIGPPSIPHPPATQFPSEGEAREVLSFQGAPQLREGLTAPVGPRVPPAATPAASHASPPKSQSRGAKRGVLGHQGLQNLEGRLRGRTAGRRSCIRCSFAPYPEDDTLGAPQQGRAPHLASPGLTCSSCASQTHFLLPAPPFIGGSASSAPSGQWQGFETLMGVRSSQWE